MTRLFASIVMTVILSLLMAGIAFCEGFVDRSRPVTELVPLSVERWAAKTNTGVHKTGIWNWSPAKDYHAAAVKIQSDDGDGGSGTVIATDRGCVVITNHHVAADSPGADVVFQTGLRARGQVILGWEQPDLCGILVRNPPRRFASIAIAAGGCQISGDVEVLGFGGPSGRFRPYFARPVRHEAPLSIDAPSVSGDSGSGMIFGGRLVGVQFGAFARPSGSITDSRGSAWPLVYPASSATTTHVLRQFAQAVCDRVGCRPSFQPCNPGSQQLPGGDSQFYPQQDAQVPMPSMPELVPPSNARPSLPETLPIVPLAVDYDRLIDMLADDKRFRGDDGSDGARGPQGLRGPTPNVDYERIVGDVLDRVPKQPSIDPTQIAAAVLRSIPKEQVRIIDSTTGQLIGELTIDLMDNKPSVLRFDPGREATFDLSSITDQDVAGLAARLPKPSQRVMLVDGKTSSILDD
ncbi:MAG: trypsin-like peptidase domain-containing protein, partial [Planctomycetota bacterium]